MDERPTGMEAMRRRDFVGTAAAAMAGPLLRATGAFAQGTYPTASIRVIVPYSPGGVVDVVARHWAESIKRSLGTVVIENQAGGGGTIGANAVVRSNLDGHTLLFGDTSCL